MHAVRVSLGVLFVVAVAGCGHNTPGASPDGGPATAPPIAGLSSITVSPANATLIVDGTGPVLQAYSATGTFTDGHSEDVTDRVAFSSSNGAVALFSGRMLTTATDRGGELSVLASAGGVLGSTGLSVVLKRRVFDPNASVPPMADQHFGGPADPGRAPQVVYPNDGVLVPPNLGHLEVHFLPGKGNTLFEIGFQNALTDVRVYTRCTQPLGSGCIYNVDDQTWKWLSQTNQGGVPVSIVVRGTDDNGAGVGASAPVGLSVSQDAILGAVYYWTTSNGTGIMRYDFASQDQKQAQRFVGSELTGGACIGCHALSRDGGKLVAEAGGQSDGRLLLLDVASGKPMVPFGSPSMGKSTFESWNDRGDRFAGVYGDTGATDYNVRIFDGTTGVVLSSIAGTGSAAHPADHPDWSPDGQKIAYVKVGLPNTLQRMSMGSIMMVALEGQNWGAPVEILPPLAGKNRYYPAFAPDSSFIVFDESTCSTGASGDDCDADTDPTARLFAVKATAGAQPIELLRANAPGLSDGGTTALTNSFPKWSPFVFRRTGEAGSRLMWITFSSSRHFGLRPPPAPGAGSEASQGTLLWMAAIDPDKVASGLDGSYPAFVLPFQDVATSNHIAQWTQQIVPPIQ